MTIYVQFDRSPFGSDGTTPDMDAVIIGYSTAPQSAETWPFQGVVDASDARWKAYYDAHPDLQPYLPTPTTA